MMKLSTNEVASLLASRICHDLISPIGAINNAIELIDDCGLDKETLDLLRLAAGNASSRLQFARLAYGASGGLDHEISISEAKTVTEQFFTNEKTEIIWIESGSAFAKTAVKLLLNLIVVANASIPRGGTLNIATEGDSRSTRFIVRATGPLIRLPPMFRQLLDHGYLEGAGLDAQSIQYYYTLLLSQEAKMPIAVDEETGSISLVAAYA